MVKKYKVSKEVSKEPALIIYDQLMLTPGLWNGLKFTSDQIKLGIASTDWTNPENFALIDYHPEKGKLPSSSSWQGYFDKIAYKTLEEGVDKEGMYGDLYIYDTTIASKLLSRKSPLAVSIDAYYTPSPYGAGNLIFTNTALVYRPGCKDAYIQLSDDGGQSRTRIVCQDDIVIEDVKEEVKEENIEDIKSINLSYDLGLNRLVEVFNSDFVKVFEGSVLTFNRDKDGKTMVSVMSINNQIGEFSVNDFFFFPIMTPRETESEDEEYETKQEIVTKDIEEVKLEEVEENSDIEIKGDDKFDKMNSNNIESLEARLSLIESKLEITLEETKEEVAEVKPEETETEVKEEVIEEEVKEDEVKEVEVVEEATEEVVEVKEIEAPIVELEEAVTEDAKVDEEVIEEVVEVKPEETEEVIEETALEETMESLKSKIVELEAKLAENNAVVEEVHLEDDTEKEVAESQTAVQLEGTEDEVEEVKPSVKLSACDEAKARLNRSK